MSKPQPKRETPIIVGEQVGHSQLYRRFQGTRAVSPLYVPTEREASVISNAQSAAERHGFRSVTVYDSLYIQFTGQWYLWAGFKLHSNGRSDGAGMRA